MAGRYGGEEFAVVLPETDGERTAPVAEKLRVAIEAFEFRTTRYPLPGDPARHFTMSIGAASLPLPNPGESEALIAQAKAQMAFGGGANLQSRGPSALDLNQEGEVSSSSPSAKRRSAAPVVVGLLLAVGAASAGIYLMIRPVPHTAPSAHTTAPSVEALGSTAPSVEAPGTLPMQPWERAVEFADAGRVPEAAMQMEYLFRSSKEPHVVLAKARADVRFKAVLAMPRVRDAILFMDPVAPGDSSAPPRP